MSAEISKNEILPTLIVEAGKPRRLPAQRYEFSSVDIKEGALLIIEGGSEGVFHLICSGDFILRGSIVAQGFSSSERSHLIKIPSQTEPLEIVFKNTNKGGRGGNGGTGGVNTGGAGSAGTTEYGGGGGGGYRNAKPQPINWKGTDAQENVGGQAGQYCGCAGGMGKSGTLGEMVELSFSTSLATLMEVGALSLQEGQMEVMGKMVGHPWVQAVARIRQ